MKVLSRLAAIAVTALFAGAGPALASDDQHESQAVVMRVLQKFKQGAMGADLRHAVEIEPGVNLVASPRQLGALATSERRQRRPGRFARLGSLNRMNGSRRCGGLHR